MVNLIHEKFKGKSDTEKGGGKALVDPSCADVVDINKIIQRAKNGEVINGTRMPRYDFDVSVLKQRDLDSLADFTMSSDFDFADIQPVLENAKSALVKIRNEKAAAEQAAAKAAAESAASDEALAS